MCSLLEEPIYAFAENIRFDKLAREMTEILVGIPTQFLIGQRPAGLVEFARGRRQPKLQRGLKVFKNAEPVAEPGAVALMYEAYLLVATKTNPHYALTFLRTVTDHLVDVRNIIEKEDAPPFHSPCR